ncbi:MAG: ribosome-associated protein [Thermoleophilaceae bacterium]|nr:ribosome-associated protein [Thermoleophilaceae bacterium]
MQIPLSEIVIRTSRSSGPGGQHANVTASRVEAVFDVCASATLTDEQKRRVTARLGAVVHASAQDTRSQARNREIALARLNERVERALHVRKPRRATKPSKAATERRLKGKRVRGERKAERRRPVDD